MSTDESVTEDNEEWQLAELVDAIASEIDHAADTLSLKSYARGKSLAIKQLNLDLEVTVRRGRDGEIWFRTVVDPKENGATVLKLDFTQVPTPRRRRMHQRKLLGSLGFLVLVV
ncbi:MAG: hypothetical protein F6J99_17620, partial [Moorea sp. SIO4G3]|nr:hypothetical protein [Moorena sp. SIO4G3]